MADDFTDFTPKWEHDEAKGYDPRPIAMDGIHQLSSYGAETTAMHGDQSGWIPAVLVTLSYQDVDLKDYTIKIMMRAKDLKQLGQTMVEGSELSELEFAAHPPTGCEDHDHN